MMELRESEVTVPSWCSASFRDISLVATQNVSLRIFFLRATSEAKAKAEEVGFGPTMPCGMPVFKTGALDHYATPPCTIFFLPAADLNAESGRILQLRILSYLAGTR